MKHSTKSSGFTLIEVMVVLVIIVILMGIVLGAAKYAQTKAARSRAQAEISVMETALEQYKNDSGAYPSGDGTLYSSTNVYSRIAAGPKIYMNFRADQISVVPSTTITNVIDPFGAPYRYQSPGVVNTTSFDLWSFGPDGQNGTADDITNWRQ